MIELPNTKLSETLTFSAKWGGQLWMIASNCGSVTKIAKRLGPH